MDVRPINVLSLCSGVGGIELGLRIALPGSRPVCFVERDAYSAAVLVARMEDEVLDPAPVFDDLESFDGCAWRGVVDIVAAGFPCQPFSSAGKRLGTQDERWLWDSIGRIIREVRPSIVFLENVPPIVNRGLYAVLGTLAELRFDAEWGLSSAAGSGAPHLRKRLFILGADADRWGFEEQRLSEHADKFREPGVVLDGLRNDGQLNGQGTHAESDAVRPGLRASTSGGERRRRLGDASWWATEPDVGRVAHGVAARVDRLRCTGNGVVPAVAARAWVELWQRMSKGIC